MKHNYFSVLGGGTSVGSGLRPRQASSVLRVGSMTKVLLAIFCVTAVSSVHRVLGAAPTDIALSSTSINENNSVNAALGTLSAVDADSGDTHTFTLVTGTGSTDNASFNIDGVTLRASVAFNYEIKSSYSVRIRATDNASGTFEKAFVISIGNLPETPPTIGAQTLATLPENSVPGTVAGTVAASDPDPGDAITLYEIVDQNPAGVFVINAATGQITVASLPQETINSVLDYDLTRDPATASTLPFKLRVRVTDKDSLTRTADVTINLSNVNEDFVIADQDFIVDINAFSGTEIGELGYTDQDNDSLTFTIQSSTPATAASAFAFQGDKLILSNAAAVNFVTNPTVELTVEAKDSLANGVLAKTIKITIKGQKTNLPGGNPVLMTLPGVQITDIAHARSGEIFVVGPGVNTSQGVLTVVAPQLDDITTIKISDSFVPKRVAVSDDAVFIGGEVPGTTRTAKIYRTTLPVTSSSAFTSVDVYTTASTLVDMALYRSGQAVSLYVCGTKGTDAANNKKHYYKKYDGTLTPPATGSGKEWGFDNVILPNYLLGTGNANLNDAVGDVFAITVDDLGFVYVSGNWQDPTQVASIHFFWIWGYPVALTAANTGLESVTGSLYFYSRFATQRVGYIARFNSETARNVAYTHDFNYFSFNHEMRVKDMIFASSDTGGSLYVLQEFKGQSTLGHLATSDEQALKISRFNVNLSLVGPASAVVVNNASAGQAVYSSSLTKDDGGDIYITGILPQGTVQFALSPQPTGLTPSEFTPSFQQFFVAKLTPSLSWDWIKILNNGSYVPDTASPPVIQWYSYAKSAILGGTIAAGGKLTIRQENLDGFTLENSVVAPAAAKAGVVTFLTRSGKYVERLFIEIVSQYGISREHVQPHLGRAIGIEGQTYTARVPSILYQYFDSATSEYKYFADDPAVETDGPSEDDIKSRALKRFVNRGYTIEDTEIIGDSSTYTFVLRRNTAITFHWDLEFALTMDSDLTTTGATDSGNGNWVKGTDGLGLTSIAAGEPQPAIQKHWIKANELVVAFIQGTALDLMDYGTRYRVTGYTATGAARVGAAATGVRTFPSLENRQQIQQFVMNAPGSITYKWKPQHRVLVSTSSSRSEALPGIKVEDGSGQLNFLGTGEVWYDRGTQVTIAARNDTASNQQLLGWLSSDGQFQTPQSAPIGASKLTDTFVLGGLDYKGYKLPVTGLVRPTRVLWNFGDTVHEAEVTLGSAVSYPSAFPESQIKTPNGVFKKPSRVRIVEAPPGSSVEDLEEWDEKAKLSYPVRPGIFFLEWDKDGFDDKIVLQVTSGFGGDRIVPNSATDTRVFPGSKRHYRHLTHPELPKVDLDPSSTDEHAFLAMKYSESDGSMAGGFSAQRPGRHVLLFSKSAAAGPAAIGDRTTETLLVRVVETRHWNAIYDATDPDAVIQGAWTDAANSSMLQVPINQPAIIGRKLTSNLDTAQLQTGFLVNSQARYNANIYDRTKVADAGPIIPVNQHFGNNPEDALVVIWHEKAPENILWPYQSAQYTATWPSRSYFTIVKNDQDEDVPQPVDRIVTASRLGSEGRNSFDQNQPFFDLKRYSQVKIYNQPDRTKPGFNPNEEHALIAPSFKFLDQATPPPAAYALRTDLNDTSGTSAYTSHPYVLVEYFDRDEGQSGEFKMGVYAIEKEDFRASLNPYRYPEIDPDPEDPNDQRLFPYTFHYPMKAGEPVQPPYPLGLVIGLTPCQETRGEDLTAFRTYWEDHHGQPWAVSDGQFRSTFYYPQLVQFWNGEGSGAVVPGTCLKLETGGEVIVTGTTVNPLFVNGNTFTVNGQLVAITGTDAIAFAQAVDAVAVEAQVSATVLFGNQVRIRSTATPVQTLVFADGAGTPLATAGLAAGSRPETLAVRYTASWPDVLPILKVGETLVFAGGEFKADSPGPEQPGLPGVVGWAAGKIVFDSQNPTMNNQAAFTDFAGRLIAPLEARAIQLTPQRASELETVIQPTSGLTKVDGIVWRFVELPSSLGKRIYYDPLTDRLGIKGYLNEKTLGDPSLTATPPPVYVLEPDILTPRERDILLNLRKVKEAPGWSDVVNDLYALSRNPDRLNQTGSGAILSPGGIDPSYYAGLELDVEQQNNQDKLDANDQPITITKTARHKVSLGPGLALIPSPQLLQPGDPNQVFYLTLAENDDRRVGGPVTLHIVKIEKKHRYRGAIKTILSDNVFDERITLRHTADFGANGDDVVYQWFYREENGQSAALPPDSAWRLFPDQSDNAIKGRGLYQITLEGTGGPLLADNLFFVRYRHFQDTPADGNPNSVEWTNGTPQKTYGTEWNRDGAEFRDPLFRNANGVLDDSLRFGGQWAGAANSPTVDKVYRAQLISGWIKRVLDRVNPYEARFGNFRGNDAPATYASMIQEAGQRHEGPVALNPDKNVIENVGLIELYQTILDRGIGLSIGLSSPITTPGINNALLLAATRISDLYMLVANEAYSDAVDPTIGFGSSSVEYGSMAPAVFPFQNQMASLLEEELALLRGIDDSAGRPVYNRLFWNFTKGEGEAAYAMNYNITDFNHDGFVDEFDAQALYPQGHGDAWGHYLTALKARYSLLRHPFFNWQARSEFYNLMDVVIAVDFLDERKFAEAAAAKAQAGAEIVNLTYRSRYVEDPDGQWQGYTDPLPGRDWGVGDWARRAGQGALFDWITANALLPSRESDPAKSGIQRVDRATVADIAKISANLGSVQTTYDNANSGLNPLGLDSNVVPFDLDPTFEAGFLDIGPVTHFEQIHGRALGALKNARVSFDYANQRKNALRQVADSVDQFRQDVIAQDRDYRNRLIEIFGMPYDGAIGTGKPYPAGYAGPDLSLYMYVDIRDISSETVPAANATYAARLQAFANDLSSASGDFKSTLDTYFLNDLESNLQSWTGVVLTDNSVLNLRLPATAGSYTFQTPANWGQRAASGRLQQIISEMIQTEADLALAVGDYDVLITQIEKAAKLLAAKHGVAVETIRIKTKQRDVLIGLDAAISILRGVAFGFHTASTFTDKTGDATSTMLMLATPIGGLAVSAGDVLSVGRGTIKAVSNTISDVLDTLGNAADMSIELIEDRKEVIQLNDEIDIDKENFKYELREQIKDIEAMLINEGTTRISVFRVREQLRSLADQYRTALSEGVRLIQERESFNQKTAAATQLNRYQDMAFRVSQNDALQKYRASFDLAAQYVYLAAKAYDFETNLSPNDRGSALPLLTEIVRQRLLGEMADDRPIHAGAGLAGILAVLMDNFRVLEGQLGLNNPQREFNSFSMRDELFGIGVLPNDVNVWRSELNKYRWPNLWDSPEFRRYCRPFAKRIPSQPEPGLIIPFSTEVRAGKNFFGRPLLPGHSAFDPSNFSTKIRAAAVEFISYDPSLMAQTPRIYMIPAGMDVMAIPTSRELDLRVWNVTDQRIPVPFKTGSRDLADPDWIPVLDSLSGALGEIRRFSSFRAFAGDTEDLVFDSRLIGRSVWNTQWLLVIPGQTFLADPADGLNAFISNVTDIRLSFETYSASGN